MKISGNRLFRFIKYLLKIIKYFIVYLMNLHFKFYIFCHK